MYILYLDDAGSVEAASQRHFVLAGICVFERQTHWLAKALDDLAQRIHPEAPHALEFHGSHMLPGKGFWRSIKDRETRRRHICDALGTARALQGRWALFGVVVDKSAVSPQDPIEFAFEELCIRFDAFLKREFRRGNAQRGLIVLDKSTRETRLQALAIGFRRDGHSHGLLQNLADVPLFVDSSATRLIQFADLVSYALWQKFEKADPAFFDVIATSFDSEGGVTHGLLHRRTSGSVCACPSCISNARLM